MAQLGTLGGGAVLGGEQFTLAMPGIPGKAGPAGNNATAWQQIVNETGASFAHWTNDSGAWSSNGTEFIANPGGTPAVARYTSSYLSLPTNVKFDVFFDSTGASASPQIFMLKYGSSANGGLAGGLKFANNTPSANGQAYAELSSVVGYNGPASVFAFDTWFPMIIQFSGSSVSIWKAGTLIWVVYLGPSSGASMGEISLVAYQLKMKVRNILGYQLVTP